MPSVLIYTAADCIEQITLIEGKIAELRSLPADGEVKNTIIRGLDKTIHALELQKHIWFDRLGAARRREGGRYGRGPRRREVV